MAAVAIVSTFVAASDARADTLRFLRMSPKLLWRSSSDTGVVHYDEAAAANAAAEASTISTTYRLPDGGTLWFSVANLRADTASGSVNGNLKRWLVDVTSHYDYATQPHTTNTSSTQAAYLAGYPCLEGTTQRNNYPTNTLYWCEATNTIPEGAPNSCPAGNPIYPESGQKSQVELDYTSANALLTMERTYRSDTKRFSSVLDAGFFDYSAPVLTPLGHCVAGRYATGATDSGGQPIYKDYCFPMVAVGTTEALFWQPSGRQVAFNLTSGTAVPNANINDRAIKRADDQGVVTWQVKGEGNTLAVFSASGNLLGSTTFDGRQVGYAYSDAITAATVAPRAGLMISATDSFGRSLQFVYNSAGSLSQMLDPAGQAYSYTYDTSSADCLTGACGRYVSVQYPDQSVRQYLWNEAALTSGASEPFSLTGINEIWPANGAVPTQTVRAGSYGYDNTGLAISTKRANGLDSYTVSRTASQVTVTDPLGTQRATYLQSMFGTAYATSSSQPAGSGCAASSSALTYDANGNVASSNDFDGHRVCSAYDLSRNLETTRVEGLSSSATCSAYTAANASLVAGSRKVSTLWHPDWRLEARLAEPGRITTSIYNGQPDPFAANAIASCAPTTALLPDGKPIAVLCKQVQQATTDVDGHLGFTAALQSGVANRVQSWTYNQYGQMLTAKDPLNNTTTYAYYTDTAFTGVDPNAVGHTIGDLQTVTNAQGQVTTYSQYDKHGQLLQSSDLNGVVTTNTYDLRQRLLSTSVGGQTTGYSYDPAGQLLKITAPDTNWVGYEYDPAHRLTATKDNLGNRIEYTLDNAGNRTAENVKDPGGVLARTLSRSIDALGRVQQTTGRE